MANDNDTILIQTLIDSYRIQLEYYCGLRDLVRQLMGRLVLSRGALSQLTDGLRKKQTLIDAIQSERNRIAECVAEWQLRKASVTGCAAADVLDKVLQQVTEAIQEFLNDEEQLQKYLEGVLARSAHS
jgi:hypothetical protein